MIPLYRIYIKHLDWMTYHISSINFHAKTVEVRLTSPDEGDPSEYNFDEVIIMEFVGRQDKNGNDIYEGDKLRGLTRKEPYAQKTSKVIIGLVVWSDYNDGRHIRSELPNGYRTYLEFHGSEIIGNIYQNPELS